jgi:hypothetical protein
MYSPRGQQAKSVAVEQLALLAICPASNGLVRWFGIDLDASDHGDAGLADPGRVMRCIAERADNA